MAGHTQRQWIGKFVRCGMRCYWCFVPLTILPDGVTQLASKDHLTPLARGGRNTIDNIVPACSRCNSRKGAMTEPEFHTALSETFNRVTAVGCSLSPLAVGVPAATNFSMIDQPHIGKLRKESEGTSWAWRNPPKGRIA